jgi:transposase
MQAITTIGLDIAKSVFQVHGIDAAGQVVVRRQLKRRQVIAFFQKMPPCLVGIEACASSHYWSRELQDWSRELQALGHSVRLMPPAYVKPYVKRQKNDMADAEAICEAVTRANMRFVTTKTPEQQSGLMLHRTRHLFMRQQISVINAIRAHLAEFGIVASVGRRGIEELLRVAADPSDKRVPEMVRTKRASASIAFQAWAHCWQLLLSRVSPILKPFDQVVASRPGSAWYPSSIRAGAGRGSVVSANRVIVIYAVCS